MSAYLYALIPYKSGIDFTYSEEPCYWHPLIREFANVDSELTDRECLQQYGEYIVVNRGVEFWAYWGHENNIRGI